MLLELLLVFRTLEWRWANYALKDNRLEAHPELESYETPSTTRVIVFGETLDVKGNM